MPCSSADEKYRNRLYVDIMEKDTDLISHAKFLTSEDIEDIHCC